jgi:hypothetical protein
MTLNTLILPSLFLFLRYYTLKSTRGLVFELPDQLTLISQTHTLNHKMVGTNLSKNPLDPTVLQERNSIDGKDKSAQTRNMSDLNEIIDRNVAP